MKRDKCLRVGGIFFLATTLLGGCDTANDTAQTGQQGDWDSSNSMTEKKAGVVTEVREVTPGEYRITDEYTSNATGVIAQKLDGSREMITEDKVKELVNTGGGGPGYGLGAVLASGLVGYMLGSRGGLRQAAYADESLYTKALSSRELLDKRRKEEEEWRSRPGTRSGGISRWWFRGGSTHPSSTSVSGRRTGFFSRFTSSLRGLG